VQCDCAGWRLVYLIHWVLKFPEYHPYLFLLLLFQGNELHSLLPSTSLCVLNPTLFLSDMVASLNLYVLLLTRPRITWRTSSSAGQTLQLQCALNLMSCYLKSAKFEECVNESSEVCLRVSTFLLTIVYAGVVTVHTFIKVLQLSWMQSTFPVSVLLFGIYYVLFKWKHVTLFKLNVTETLLLVEQLSANPTIKCATGSNLRLEQC
jgi:hypothetical protein